MMKPYVCFPKAETDLIAGFKLKLKLLFVTVFKFIFKAFGEVF